MNHGADASAGTPNIADLHIHTTFSDGAAAPLQVIERAIRVGLSVIAITDHDGIEGALRGADYAGDRLGVVVGEEVTTLGGHVLGLFLVHKVDPGRLVIDTIDDIHAQGGIAIPAHPYFHLGGARGVGGAGEGLHWDAIEVENGSPGAWLANRTARARKEHWARAETGGSDAHILSAVGSSVTAFAGESISDLRFAVEAGLTTAVRRDRSPTVAARTLAWTLGRRIRRATERLHFNDHAR